MKRICLGKISAPHGVRGLIKLSFYGEDPALLEHPAGLYTTKDGHDTLKVSLKNPHGKYWLCEIEGINNRDQVDAIRGTELYIDRDALPEIEEEDSFYYEDLIGMEARGESGEKIGTVIAVHNFGAGDLLEIRPVSGDTYLLPFTKDAVPKIHQEDRFLVICPPEEEI